MKQYNNITTIRDLNEFTEKKEMVLVYFSHEKCNVCKVLKPKVAQMVEENFSKVKMLYSDTVKYPEIAGQNSVFTVPTIITFVEGKEYFRKSRSIGLSELSNLIERPYKMIFED